MDGWVDMENQDTDDKNNDDDDEEDEQIVQISKYALTSTLSSSALCKT